MQQARQIGGFDLNEVICPACKKRITVIGFKGGLVRCPNSKCKAFIYYKANCKVYKVILRDKEFLIK